MKEKIKKWFTLKNFVFKGFTLIELLVVISIIGLLATIALVSYTSVQKSARDIERKSDLRQYQTALEQYANKNNGVYPSRHAGAGQPASSILCPDLGLTTCPEDPKYASDNTYQYKYQSDGSGSGVVDATIYVLWGKLENVTNMFWVVCSTGQSGKISSSTTFTDGACPAGLTQ